MTFTTFGYQLTDNCAGFDGGLVNKCGKRVGQLFILGQWLLIFLPLTAALSLSGQLSQQHLRHRISARWGWDC
jgi:hypothetical protein